MDVSGLGGIYGGFLQGQDAQIAIRQKQQQAKAFQDDQDSLTLLGNAFGVQGPQPPAPGQASQPPPQGLPAPQQGQAPPGAGPPPVAGPPGTGGQQNPAMGLYTGPLPASPPTGVTQMPPISQQLRGVQGQAGLPTPPQAPPPQQQPQPGVGGLSQGPQPQPSQAPPQQGPQAAGGMLTLDQLAKKILSAPGNAQKIQQNPGLLVRALEKGQALLAPEGRAELAQAKQDLENKKAELQYDAKIKQINEQADAAVKRAATAQQVAEIGAARAQAVAEVYAANRRETTNIIVGERGREADQTNSTRRYGIDAHSASAADATAVKKELGDAKNLNDDKKIAATKWFQEQKIDVAKLGISEKAQEAELKDRVEKMKEAGRNTRSDAKIAFDEKKLAATAAKAKNGDISDEEADYFAKALKTDPAMVLRLMGAGGAGTAAKQRIAKAFMANPDNKPEDLAKAEVILSGKKAGAQTAERQGAKVDIGAEEIKSFGPKVEAAARAAGSTKYPTWNALQQAVTNKTGGPEAVALNDAITNYRNALIQVAQRGGATSEGAQARADQYINRTMSIPQIVAAIRSGKAEAEVAQGAVKKVTSGLANSFGDKPAEDAPAPSPTDPAALGKPPG